MPDVYVQSIVPDFVIVTMLSAGDTKRDTDTAAGGRTRWRITLRKQVCPGRFLLLACLRFDEFGRKTPVPVPCSGSIAARYADAGSGTLRANAGRLRSS